MGRRSKHILLLVLAQVGCLGVGLWVQHQYAQSTVRQAAKREARAQLAALAQELGAYLTANSSGDAGATVSRVDRLPEAIRFRIPKGQSVLVVDHQWVVRMNSEPAGDEIVSTAEVGKPLEWKDVVQRGAIPGVTRQGMLRLNGAPHLASAAPLSDSSGFAVVHTPEAAVVSSATNLVRELPMLAVMTLVWTCAMLSVVVYLVLARFYEEVERERQESDTDTLRRTQNLVRTRDAVIFGLAKLADSRDPETGDHLERISTYSTVLASSLTRNPKFRDDVTSAFVRLIGISSALHDIGKVGIEDSILRKPSGLTADERARMATHTSIGGDCLKEIEQRLGSSNFLQMAREIAVHHHERWDGKGYPLGLAGEDIPLPARIVAIVDVYDALSGKRVYKDAMPHEECAAIIRNEAGKHFDPDLVDVWLQIEDKFRQIASQYQSVSPGSGPRPLSIEPVLETVTKSDDHTMLAATSIGWDELRGPR